jgi:uncharacterized SAM-dependent methyltransferase
MKYFKNTELAKIYHISEKSVRNWIKAAESGEYDLTLHEERGKKYVANTAKNTNLIEDLVEKGKKFKNTRGFKAIKPSQKFYKLYSPKQIVDIISNLDIHQEIPVQYTYFNSGAERWDNYTRRLLNEDASNALSNTVELLNANLTYLDKLVQGCSGVNIIDLGVGNALPVKNFLEHFIEKGLLKRYIAIDISKDMLDLAETNVNNWFKGKVKFEGHVRDMVYERFDDLLVSDSFGMESGQTVNVVLFLGGTLSNFREPDHALSTIHDSMGRRDLLLFTKKLDNEKNRRYFELAAPGNQAIELVLDLLNVSNDLYKLEPLFDQQKRAREVRAILNIALSIEFELGGQKRTIELHKGDSIILWRAIHQNIVEIIEQFHSENFDLLKAMRSLDKSYAMTISAIKTGQ